MIEEEAVVAMVEETRVAVEKERRSACSSCEQKTCASGVTSRLFGTKMVRLWATKTCEVRPGDRVIIGLQEDALVQGAFIIYLFPLAGLFVGALLGNAIATLTNLLSADSLSGLGGLLGMLLCLAAVRYFGFAHRLGAQPVILRKLN